MKQTLDNFIVRLRSISQLVNDEDDQITKLYSLGEIIPIAMAAEVFLEEPRPASNALRAFLEALPKDILCAILVLMYAGRDGDTEVLDYVDFLCKGVSLKEKAVIAIGEKVDRMEYIEKGMQYLGRNNLEVFLEKIRGRVIS